MATAKKSFGTLLKRETSPGSGTYTTIGGLKSVPFPRLSTDVQDSTDHEAASGFRTRVPTLNSLDPFTVEVFYDSSDATQDQMVQDQIAHTVRNYKIIGVDAGDDDWAFAAYVTGFEVTGEVDGLHMATVTLTPSGAVTRT